MILIKIFIFIFGSIVGSFLNVCIYRMPRNLSIYKPARSFCPHCKKEIFWFDNIPFLSFIFLGGRCRFCKTVISWRYFIVELLTALSFLALFNYFGLSVRFFIYALFTSALIAASFIDIEHQIIPDEISIGGTVIGFILSIIFPLLHNTNSHLWSALRSAAGLLIGGGVIYLIGIIGDFIFKKESMGGGDIKLMAMIGAFLGWQRALLTFFIAPFIGSLVSVIINTRKLQRLELKGSFLNRLKSIATALFTGVIPYGPFLSAAALISIFYADRILSLFFIT